MNYDLKFIKNFKSDYILPSDIIDVIKLLVNVIIVPPNLDVVQNNNVSKKWNKEKVVNKSNFTKAVEDIEKDPTEKKINDIRITLNKISNKNYESQKTIILNNMKDITDPVIFHKIAQFIFEIASSNKFYSELYTNLYIELINISSVFKNILDDYFLKYKSTIETIKYVDSEIDFEGFCDNNKKNDKRKSMASFFMFLSKRNILLPETILDMIKFFQNKLIECIDEENKTLECEEISELTFILISIGKDNIELTNKKCWIEILSNISLITGYKVKEHKSLTNRVVFKQKDLTDYLK